TSIVNKNSLHTSYMSLCYTAHHDFPLSLNVNIQQNSVHRKLGEMTLKNAISAYEKHVFNT
ncbi:hypothetical protein, partial [Xylanibacter rodentium]|uniref:hypothetical protein n=1 Tax=Xylanibacter rodentium TaxID=2736289 RepID=UPI0025837726